MSKTSTRRAINLIASVGLILAGLGSVASLVGAQTVADIKQRGVLRVGVLSELPPWGFLDANGKPAGYDVDVGTLLGQKMGVPVEFVGMTVAARIAQLMTGKVDVLLATMGMYPDRAKVVQFTQPYASLNIILLGKKSQNITKIEDIGALRIGVTRGAAQDTAITAALPKTADIKRFDDDSAVIQAFIAGQVDAIGANTTYILNINKIFPNNDFEQKLVFNQQLMGVAMKPGQKDLNVFVNKFIDEAKADGTLEAISKKWIGLPLEKLPDSLPGVPYTVQ